MPLPPSRDHRYLATSFNLEYLTLKYLADAEMIERSCRMDDIA